MTGVAGGVPPPPPGDPAALEAEASTLERSAVVVAGLADDFAAQTRRVADRAGWTGQAADEYRRRVVWLAGELDGLGPALLKVAWVLAAYGASLKSAQAA